MFMENPDYFCVKCLANGDEDAFVTLYRKYHKKIYYSALNLTRSEVLSQDITQDVFLKIWDTKQTLDPNQNFAAYISVICRNAIFDTFKKAVHEEKIKKELQQFANISENPEEEDFYEEYRHILTEAIRNLPPQRRSIFERCKLQEQSYDEVAKSLGISRSTVQDHIVKANKAIREYLQNYGNFSFAILYSLLLKIHDF
ncbi:DNA-directed RNA polymerase sigma-70 factor [Bacteroidia bacterium]|nr:DNA-directed RNA polymerase sigma-70 factor [Bacteroidia bacterium]